MPDALHLPPVKAASVVVVLLCWAACPNLAGEAPGKGVAAIPARDFLQSIGVCTHIGQGIDDPERTATALAFAGIRNIRDDASPRHLQDWIAVHKMSGAKVVLTRSGPDDAAIPAMIDMSKELAQAGALLALEGPNEPNNWTVTFEGQKSGGRSTFIPVAKWQATYYAAAKADPVLKDYRVFHSSEAGGSEPDNVGLQFLTIPEGAHSEMPNGTKYADYANVHNYICRKPAIIDNMAWINADSTFRGWTDGLFVEYGKTWAKGFPGYSDADLETLPRVTTETGWATGGKEGLTAEQQGRLYLNLYLAQFKRGFKYTFIYMLRDAGGSDAGYGMFLTDYRPKRSAIYLHNLTSILRDEGTSIKSATLDYAIRDVPATVHDLLLQKSDGTVDLVVWSEKASGTSGIVVALGASHPSVRVYDPTTGTESVQALSGVSEVPLTLSDHPVILEIPRGTE